MPYLLNAVYLFGLFVASPWLLYRALTTGRYRCGLLQKLWGMFPHEGNVGPAPVWFHGVSVGEVHLLRQVVAVFRQRHPDLPVIVSTGTDTGFAEARRCFADLPVFYFPLDFSWAVRRTLRAIDPALVVLAESELWPNFLCAARKHGVPVAVINGRLSPRSFRRWRRLQFVISQLLARVDLLAVQTDEYARNFMRLGAEPEKVRVTGSVKYDGVMTDRQNRRTRELADLLGLGPDDLVWIAGSTQSPEEEIVLRIFRELRAGHPNLRLLLVPRQKDRFDEVARLLASSGEPFVRRSAIPTASDKSRAPIILVDTIGELSALWGLADVAFVGGSLDGRRGGQNMIEPAAYGAAVVFGPHVWNFADTASRLVEAGAAVRVQDAGELQQVVRELLADQDRRKRHGSAAQALVARQQGATLRTVQLLEDLLSCKARQGSAA